jgi:hypothetical protein
MRYKDLLAAHERAEQKIAAGRAELKKAAKALRLQQGQLQKTAQAAIGATVLRGLSEGWITLDVDRLRREALATPSKGPDPSEAINDLLDATLRSALPVPAKSGMAMSEAPAAAPEGFGQTEAGALDGRPVERVRPEPEPEPARRPAANRPMMRRTPWQPAGDPPAPGGQDSKP